MRPFSLLLCGGALAEAARGSIVILGVQPDRPETGFGYIQAQHEHVAEGSRAAMAAMHLRRCWTVPLATCWPLSITDAATAQNDLHAGGYFWNAGMFCSRHRCGSKPWSSFAPTYSKPPALLGKRAPDGRFVRPGAARVCRGASAVRGLRRYEALPRQYLSNQDGAAGGRLERLGAWDAVGRRSQKTQMATPMLYVTTDSRNTLDMQPATGGPGGRQKPRKSKLQTPCWLQTKA